MFIPLHDQNALQNIRLQYVTLGLIAINFLVWLFTATPTINDETQANMIFLALGFVPAVVNDHAVLPPEIIYLPEAASYITYAFLHADFMHMAGNMLFLWVFGDNVEDAMGHFRYLIFYLLCAIVGAYAHKLAFPTSEAPLIGASGAAAGVLSAYLMLHPKVKVWVLVLGRIPLRLQAFWLLGAWIAYQVFQFLFMEDGLISWPAHIGGVVAGIILVVFFKRPNVRLFDRGVDEKEVIFNQIPTEKSASQPKWGRGRNEN